MRLLTGNIIMKIRCSSDEKDILDTLILDMFLPNIDSRKIIIMNE